MEEENAILVWLRSAGMEKYYPKFYSRGITEDNFLSLQSSDIMKLGIVDPVEKSKFIKLQQIILREFSSNSSFLQQNISSQNSKKNSLPEKPSKPFKKKSYINGSRISIEKKTQSFSSSSTRPQKPASNTSKIRVAVRKRPLNAKEKRNNESDIITSDPSKHILFVHEPKVRVDLSKYMLQHEFVFDAVFNEDSTNEKIYETTVRDLVDSIFYKGRATCFAYGQTGSGKTFTMLGPGTSDLSQQGLYILAAKDIFKYIKLPEYSLLKVWISFFEIYGGKMFDLLNGRTRLSCREDGKHNVNIIGLKEFALNDVSELMSMIEKGNNIRSTGTTSANFDSSRSHAVLSITLRDSNKSDCGKFSFIDLAGSERGADTLASDRKTRLEGAEINKSLLALKECIRALDLKSAHKPFRGSKLTQVLKDSLSGNAQTVMIANISPNQGASEHTLNTLRYADRVKEYQKDKNTPSQDHNAYMPHLEKIDNLKITQFANNEDDDLEADSNQEPNYDYEEENEEVLDDQDDTQDEQTRGDSFLDDDVYTEEELAAIEKEEDLCSELSPPRLKIWNKQNPLEPSSKEEAQRLEMTHEIMLTDLGNEIESVLDCHRDSIQDIMLSCKEEVEMIKGVDHQKLDYSEYISRLNTLLQRKSSVIQNLMVRLSSFQEHLQQEETFNASISRFPTEWRTDTIA